MNRYFTVCRLRWPALLLLTGVIALLDEMNILSWDRAWPLYLILLGVLALAERAALASEPLPPPAGYPYAAGYPAPGYPPPPQPYSAPAAAPPAPAASTGLVPVRSEVEIASSDPTRTPRKTWEEEGR